MIECPACDESGIVAGERCKECDGEGYYTIDQCPRQYVGNEMTEAVNIAGMCGDNRLPVAGGILDQSAWFMSLLGMLKSEENRIEIERIKRE